MKSDLYPWIDIKPGPLSKEETDQLNGLLNQLLSNTRQANNGPSKYLSFGGGLHQESDQDYQINNARRARLTTGQDSVGFYSWQEQYSSTVGVGGWIELEGCGSGNNNNDTYTCTQPAWEANSLNPVGGPGRVVQLRRAYVDPNIGSWTYVYDRVYQLYAGDNQGNSDPDVCSITISGSGGITTTFSKGMNGNDSYNITFNPLSQPPVSGAAVFRSIGAIPGAVTIGTGTTSPANSGWMAGVGKARMEAFNAFGAYAPGILWDFAAFGGSDTWPIFNVGSASIPDNKEFTATWTWANGQDSVSGSNYGWTADYEGSAGGGGSGSFSLTTTDGTNTDHNTDTIWFGSGLTYTKGTGGRIGNDTVTASGGGGSATIAGTTASLGSPGYNLTNAMASTGLTLVLPSAGTYFIFATVSGTETAPSATEVHYYNIFLTTAAQYIWPPDVVGFQSQYGLGMNLEKWTTTANHIITVGSADTLNLRAYSVNGSGQLYGGTTVPPTLIGYLKIG